MPERKFQTMNETHIHLPVFPGADFGTKILIESGSSQLYFLRSADTKHCLNTASSCPQLPSAILYLLSNKEDI